ncbi:DNA oxidative demethylase ALKBH2 isoform X2 [Macadamia integrifolia]|uniref:DNA oxidative demethylase ALKBH2 isoform X2 n=1 Tax=Macadamia integrifolia TaxID=60698 RepID=UPI001C4F7AEB|nr:DNA oxidative demethylase ALKBH2 isoform X2 [Macadamia integrifolia]
MGSPTQISRAFLIIHSPLAPISSMSFKLQARAETMNPNPSEKEKKRTTDLGNGSEIIYFPRFLPFDDSWKWFHYLDKEIPWTRPSIHVFGRSCIQVHEALPGSSFNSLLLNRYKTGSDYVAWHSDDEKLYGPTPEIASLSFGCDREFLLRKKPSKSPKVQAPSASCMEEPANKRLKKNNQVDQHSLALKHGSLLVMRGYTQRDWVHSVPKRAKIEAVRINLTFRHVL